MHTTLPWSQCLRYCSMCKGSVTAQSLYRKAKEGRRLTPAEAVAIGGFATRMRELVGTQVVEVAVSAGVLAGARIPIPPELVLHGDRAVIILKGMWLADTVTGSVVGRYVDGPDTLTLFPNPVVLVNDLSRVLRKYAQCRT
jgi:hypothetical protein